MTLCSFKENREKLQPLRVAGQVNWSSRDCGGVQWINFQFLVPQMREGIHSCKIKLS